MYKGKTFIISGPSGVGKSTVLKELFQDRDDLYFSVSATTRPPRPGEINGVHYHFTDVDIFYPFLPSLIPFWHLNSYQIHSCSTSASTTKPTVLLHVIIIKRISALRTELRRILRIFRLPSALVTLIKRFSCRLLGSAFRTEFSGCCCAAFTLPASCRLHLRLRLL